MAEIIIEKAGFLSTIQDCGRVGYQRFGMPVSGAMDTYSLQLANLLVGNPANAAAIEATLIGPEIIFSEVGDSADGVGSVVGVVSICGAGMRPFINGSPIPMYEAVSLVSGDRLTFSSLGYGCRAYIAFAGGVDVPVVLGSRSTYLRAKIGGISGRVLITGDRIPLGKSQISCAQYNNRQKIIPESLIPDYQTNRSIRIVPGPETKKLGVEEIHTFLTSEYRVTEQSDRMGLRLFGPAIQIKSANNTNNLTDHDIISAGISPGTIQLPGNGQPIILMADRQTTGGYARIANVASVDLTRVAQLKPGDKIHFQEITIEKAQELFTKRQKLLQDLL